MCVKASRGMSHLKLFTCESLKQICLNNVCTLHYKSWNEIGLLPKSLKKELLKNFTTFDCSDVIDEEYQKYLINKYNTEWKNIRPFDEQKYIDVCMLSVDVIPPFVYEENHLIREYYELHHQIKYTREKLCEKCCSKKAKFYKPHCGNKWIEKGWIFTEIFNHSKCNGEDVMSDIIWNTNCWCSECCVEPLFNILDFEDCNWEYLFHNRRRHRNYVDSSSSEESEDDDDDDKYKKIKIIRGKCMDHDLYKRFKRNKSVKRYS